MTAYMIGQGVGVLVIIVGIISNQMPKRWQMLLGKGLVIITSLDISDSYHESKYLLSQMCKYATSGKWEQCPQMTEASLTYIINGTNLDVEEEF